MNRIDRLMATILFLQGRRLVRAEEIAGHFEISLRTVYRDIAALSEGGVPIAAEAGVGYSLLDEYRLPPVMFTPEEAGALFLGGELVNQLTDLSLQAPMKTALLKIRAVLPRSQQDRLDRLEGTTAFLARFRSPGSEGKLTVLSRIQSALAGRRVLRIAYRKDGEAAATWREVEPLGLIHYADHWHLIAHCRMRNNLRDFRSDRITDLEIRSEVFVGHSEFSLRKLVDSWRDGARAREVVVRVHRRVLDRFRRAWIGAIVDETAVAADGVRLTLMASECEWLTGWLLGFGTAITVESPVSLRQRLALMAEGVARHHASDPEGGGSRHGPKGEGE